MTSYPNLELLEYKAKPTAEDFMTEEELKEYRGGIEDGKQ